MRFCGVCHKKLPMKLLERIIYIIDDVFDSFFPDADLPEHIKYNNFREFRFKEFKKCRNCQ